MHPILLAVTARIEHRSRATRQAYLATVDTHRKNLISKLNVRNTVGLVKYAMEHGLT